MKVYEGIVEALLAEGIDSAFGLIGGGIEHLASELVRRRLRWVGVRHEQAAVAMADGYARAGDRIGLAVVSHGPGLANAATSMVVARKSRSRVLVVTSDVGSYERYTPHGFEQESFLRTTIGEMATCRSPQVLDLQLADAMSALWRGAGPVALNVPSDLFLAELPTGWSYRPVARTAARQRVLAGAEELDRAAELLAGAERPLVLAGRGAVRSGAREALQSLAEHSGAALAETLLARGYFSSHPSSLGLCGGFGDPQRQRLIEQADVVLAVGCSLNRYTTHWGRAFEAATVVRIETDVASGTEMTTPDLTLWGDAATSAQALVDRLAGAAPRRCWATDPAVSRRIGAAGAVPGTADAAGGPGGVEDPASDWASELGLGAPPAGAGRGVDQSRAVGLLADLVPSPRTLVVDAGNAMGAPAAHFPVSDPSHQIFPWSFGAIGGGLAVALGAALACPDRPTVAFLGDGSLMLGLADLDTVARTGARLLVVVTDDGGFRSERGSYLGRGLEAGLADYANPDLAALASVLGLSAYRASDDDELDRCLEQLAASDPDLRRPTLLCLAVDPLYANPEMVRAFERYRPY